MEVLNNPKFTAYMVKPVHQELYQLGTPKQRLMAILSKDNDINTWFSERIDDIISYRKNTLNKMFEFHNEVINPHQNIRSTSEADNDVYRASLEIFWKYLEK